MTKFAIKIKYLDYNNKWHHHTTKWYEDYEDAWKEQEKFTDDIEYLECKSGLVRKEVA